MSVRIRPAVRGDASEIARVHVDSWRWAYADLIPHGYLDALSLQRRARHWASFIDADRTAAMAWVAHDRDGCCGLASAGPARGVRAGAHASAASNVGEVYALYVSERVAGRGVGHALFAYTTAQLKATQHTSAMLWVLEDNLRARRFYDREGWWRDGGRQHEQVAGMSLPTVRYQRAL